MFKKEKLLIKIAAILGIVGILLLAILYISLEIIKNMPQMRNQEIIKIQLLTQRYYILTTLSILVVISLFFIEKKLVINNYKIIGIALIILGIGSIWLLWFVPVVLIILAGIFILYNGNRYKEDETNKYFT